MGWQMDASTTTPLGSGLYYRCAARAVGENNILLVSTTSNVNGTLLVQESADGTNWVNTNTSAVTGGQVKVVRVELSSLYWRITYNNGESAQSSFYLGAALSKS